MSRVIAKNEKVLDSYAQRLASDDLQLYALYANKFGLWLRSDKAYYPAVRPKILELLEIAQTTLGRQLGPNAGQPALPVELNPWVDAYARLIREVIPYRSKFTETGARERLEALASGIEKHRPGSVAPVPQQVVLQAPPPPASRPPTYILKLRPDLSIDPSHTVKHSPPTVVSSQRDSVQKPPTSSGPLSTATQMVLQPPSEQTPVPATATPSQPLGPVKTEDLPNTLLDTPITGTIAQVKPSLAQPSTSSQKTSLPAQTKTKKKKKSSSVLPEFLVADLEWYQSKGQEKQAIKPATELHNIPVNSSVTQEAGVSTPQPILPAQVQQGEVTPTASTVFTKQQEITRTGSSDPTYAQNDRSSAEANDLPRDQPEKAVVVSEDSVMSDISTEEDQDIQQGGDHTMVVDVQEDVATPTPVQRADSGTPSTEIAKLPGPQEDKSPAPHDSPQHDHVAGPKNHEPVHESSLDSRPAEVQPSLDEKRLPRARTRESSADSARHRNKDDRHGSPSSSEVAAWLMADAGSDHEESVGFPQVKAVDAKPHTPDTFTISDPQVAVDTESESGVTSAMDTLASNAQLSTPTFDADSSTGISKTPRDDAEGAIGEPSDMLIDEVEPSIPAAITSATAPLSVPVDQPQATAELAAAISTPEISTTFVQGAPPLPLLENGVSDPIIPPQPLSADNEVRPQVGTDELTRPISNDVDMEPPDSREDEAELPADNERDATGKVEASRSSTGIGTQVVVDFDGIDPQRAPEPLPNDDVHHEQQMDVDVELVAQPAEDVDDQSPMDVQHLEGTASALALDDETTSPRAAAAPENDEPRENMERSRPPSARDPDSSISGGVDQEPEQASRNGMSYGAFQNVDHEQQMDVDVEPVTQPAEDVDDVSLRDVQHLEGTASASALGDETTLPGAAAASENDKPKELSQPPSARDPDSSMSGGVEQEPEQASRTVFGPEMAAIAIQRGSSKHENISIEFNIDEHQFALITKWNNREETTKDVSDGLCLSLACYSCADVRTLLENTTEYPPLGELVACGSKWPNVPSGLGMNVKYKDRRNTFPLSPPYLVTPDNMVDVTEFLELGPNTVNIRQYCDMSEWIYVLHAHFPTAKQLEKITKDRQVDGALKEWLENLKKPWDMV